MFENHEDPDGSWYTYDEAEEEALANEEILEAFRARSILRAGSTFKNLGEKWTDSRLGSKGWIGPCMRQISLAAPTTFPEWWNYFMENTTENYNGARYTGFERMERTGRAWNLLNPELTPGEAWNHAVIHAIDETWNGYLTELRVEAAVQRFLDRQEKPMKVHRVHPSYDEANRIDLMVHEAENPETDRFLLGIQVKPLTYFTSPRVSTWQKEATHCAHLALQHDERVPTCFLAEHPRTKEISLWVDSRDTDGHIVYHRLPVNTLLEVELQV